MKTFLKKGINIVCAYILLGLPIVTQAQLLKKFKDKINQAIDKKTDKAIDNTVNSAEKTIENNNNEGTPVNHDPNKPVSTPTTSISIAAYKNYDFIPGEKIIFEDHFDTDEEGEFPTHWKLAHGQAAVNVFDNRKVFLLTSDDTKAIPAIKTKAYLTDSFTIEFDTYSKEDYGPGIGFYNSEEEVSGDYLEMVSIILNDRFGNLRVMPKESKNNVQIKYPDALQSDNYKNIWHHIAIAYKNKRLKIYVDAFRVASISTIEINANVISLRGNGSPDKPVMISNFKLAQGSGIKTPETKFTETKIVTHGINFDINKADIKPESMGTLNSIVEILKSNPELKFSIQGHTDNSGNSANNLALSQKRAEAVKQQLVVLGIEESRLTCKGLGDTMPISENNTLEGKANNRRVEFIKNN
jgi:outer membrane protein OmpA-like peptidoglycan-associated protein